MAERVHHDDDDDDDEGGWAVDGGRRMSNHFRPGTPRQAVLTNTSTPCPTLPCPALPCPARTFKYSASASPQPKDPGLQIPVALSSDAAGYARSLPMWMGVSVLVSAPRLTYSQVSLLLLYPEGCMHACTHEVKSSHLGYTAAVVSKQASKRNNIKCGTHTTPHTQFIY